MQAEGPDEARSHAVHGVEGRDGALEDRRDPAAAQLSQAPLRRAHDLLAVEPDAPLDGRTRVRRETEDRHRGHRLARSGFPGEPDDLARAEPERLEVDHATGPEGDPEVAHHESLLGGRGSRHRSSFRVVKVDTAWGSRISRRPSPSRLNPTAVIKIASPGKVTSHHCVWK